MKKKILKLLKYILIGISIYVAVLIIEFCCIYAIEGDNAWKHFKDALKWYLTFSLI